MKKIFAAALVLLLLAAPGWPSKEQPKTILNYQQELSLSEAQVKEIKSALSDLNKYVKTAGAKLSQLETDYRRLLAKDPSVEEARAKLQEIAKEQVEVRLYDFQISRRITGALSPAQLKKWREIQSENKRKP